MPPDQPRQTAANRDEYSLTINDVAARYEAAGFPRTIRTLQRYCAKGHLDSIRQETPFGDQFLITPASATRHLAQIAEFAAAVGHDQPGPAATDVAPALTRDNPAPRAATESDQPRLAATIDDNGIFEHPYVKRLEGEVQDYKDKYEKQVRRTEDILEDANKRLVEMAQAGQIAGSKTLAEYLLAAKNVTAPSVSQVDRG
jgi:hypothetical protein